MTNSYATDGICHNCEAGTFNHECGRFATWIGTKETGFQSGFCDECKEHGRERIGYLSWQRTKIGELETVYKAISKVHDKARLDYHAKRMNDDAFMAICKACDEAGEALDAAKDAYR